MMGEQIRAHDWAGTPLGPATAWEPSLRTAIELCLSSAFPGFVFWGDDLVQFYNDAAIPLMRDRHPAALGRPLREFRRDALEALQPLAERVMQRGETVFQVDFAFPGHPTDAEEELFTFSCGPLRDAAGRVAGMTATVIETTQHVRIEAGLRESRRRLRSLIEGIPQLVWRSARAGHWTWCSPQWTAHTGLTEVESLGAGWLAALHPEDREAAMAAWRRADAGEDFEAEYRIRSAGEDRYCWFQTRATPLRDEKGRTLEWLGTSTDVDELRGMEQRQRLLLAELQHRVRNTLGVIRSIIRRTVQASGSIEDLSLHLDGRINAFARVQAAVARDPTAGLDLAQLIADELLAHAAREGEQVVIEGPLVQLQPKAAETLGLAIHELTTNAVKYGALSASEGKIKVTWQVERRTGSPQLVLSWQESGVPGGAATTRRRGFGTELLERTLPYDLQAEVRQVFGAGGLHCTITLPFSDRVAIGGTPAAAT
jgi:PAS domain S-box-containing protein